MAIQSIKEIVESLTDRVDYPDRLRDKVKQFNEDRDYYRSTSFKEMALRSDFLNPVLEEMGWDPTNRRGSTSVEREVIQEDSLRIEGSSKAPDYALLFEGKRKFFVEAKRPSVNIGEGREAAFQIRRYCWSADLPYGLVTDFEEFAIYDCRAIPDVNDSSLVGRVAYFTCDQLEENWHLLTGLFGREAVSGGILEILASETKAPQGTRAIDTAFLSEIRDWRHDLATDIAQKNEDLSGLEVNGAVQTLIDRIVFLRNAEARGLEAERSLSLAAERDDGVYAQLLKLFHRADDRYNSGLFHLAGKKDDASIDRIGLELVVSDALLRKIIGRLYYPEPYEFSVLPADILGRIYEQFLAERISVDANRVATVELKPEFRKSGGVYYTPSPIVDYIVEETLSPLLKGKTPSEVAKIAIADPAAGSGSFLIAAYQYLLNWHRDYYAEKTTLAKRYLEEGADGQVRVKTAERKRILLNNIYGVDIDPQAVEVTKLSLLLKVIEGQAQMELELGRILPDLDHNVVCGNSLIGFDFAMPLSLDREEQLVYNPFDWHEAFPHVFKRGGFDALIGNPPYLNVDATWGRRDPRLAYLRTVYSAVYADKTDLLFYFFKKAADICRGETTFIVSRSFLEADKAQKLRGWLANHVAIRSVLDFRHAPVFPKVGINTAIVRFSKSKAVKQATFSRYLDQKLPVGYSSRSLRDDTKISTVTVPTSQLGSSAWNFGSSEVQKVLAKIDSGGIAVGKILHVGEGMQTGRNGSFVFAPSPARVEELTRDRLLYERVRNSDIHRYEIRSSGVHMLYTEGFRSFDRLPKDVQEQLRRGESELRDRAAFKRGNCEWWKFTWPLHRGYFDRARIFCPYRAAENRFALDERRDFLGITDTTVLYENGQPEDLRYILAILNSRVLTARFRFIGKLLGGKVLEYYENTVSKLPIPRAKPGETTHDEIVKLVKIIEEATSNLKTTLIEDERQNLQDQIRESDLRIEVIVQRLFGLTQEDIDLLAKQVD